MSEPSVSRVAGWRARIRKMFTQGLTPRALAGAAALGAAGAVAPIPGLQMAAVALLALRLRLNLGIALLVSNISFGPLLAVWAAVAASLGHWLRDGSGPRSSYLAYVREFHEAAPGLRGFIAVAMHGLGDWLLGSLLLMPALALVTAALVFAGAHVVAHCRRKTPPHA